MQNALFPLRSGRGARRGDLGADWRPVRQQRRGPPGRDHAAVPGVHRGARRGRPRVRGRRAVGPPGLQRDRRDVEDAGPAFELLRSQELLADARAAGRQVLRPRDPDSGHRRRHHGHVDLRRLAGLQEGPAPRRRHRPDRRQRRQGLDQRAGGRQAEGPEGHDRQHLAPPPRLRRADRSRRRARRSQHRHRPRRVHDRQGHRLHQAG